MGAGVAQRFQPDPSENMSHTILGTTGTPIAQGCGALRGLLGKPRPWDASAEGLREQIRARLAGMDLSAPEGRAARASAEINSLHRLGVDPADTVVLLVTDTADGRACAEAVGGVLRELFHLPAHFDLDLSERAWPALELTEQETVVPEEKYFGASQDFRPHERELFAGFVEPVEGGVTMSASAEVLWTIDRREQRGVREIQETAASLQARVSDVGQPCRDRIKSLEEESVRLRDQTREAFAMKVQFEHRELKEDVHRLKAAGEGARPA